MSWDDEKFFDRSGKEIGFDHWNHLNQLPGYSTVREFDNGTFWCAVEWVGNEIDRYNVEWGLSSQRETMKTMVAFATEKQAIDFYEHPLAENGCGEWFPSEQEPGTMRMLEIGNQATGEKPVQQTDAARVEGIESNEQFASW